VAVIFRPKKQEIIVEQLYGMAGSSGQGGGGLLAFLPFIVIMAIIYFLMIRPQAKRQKEKQNMLQALKKGDNVVSIGGIYGTIAGFKHKGKLVVLKVDKNVELTLNRSSIAGLAGKVSDEETSIVEG
jgi:preprotein translocase subunit YajC